MDRDSVGLSAMSKFDTWDQAKNRDFLLKAIEMGLITPSDRAFSELYENLNMKIPKIEQENAEKLEEELKTLI